MSHAICVLQKSSNILQVLISIQGLVLVEEPFYNEPGFEKQIGTEDGRGALAIDCSCQCSLCRATCTRVLSPCLADKY